MQSPSEVLGEVRASRYEFEEHSPVHHNNLESFIRNKLDVHLILGPTQWRQSRTYHRDAQGLPLPPCHLLLGVERELNRHGGFSM